MKIEIRHDSSDMYKAGSYSGLKSMEEGSSSIYVDDQKLFGLTYVDLQLLWRTLTEVPEQLIEGCKPREIVQGIRALLYDTTHTLKISVKNERCLIVLIGGEEEMVMDAGELEAFVNLLRCIQSDYAFITYAAVEA